MFGIMFGFKVVAHLEDDSVGGLQNSVTRMLQADPDFGEFILSKFFLARSHLASHLNTHNDIPHHDIQKGCIFWFFTWHILQLLYIVLFSGS